MLTLLAIAALAAAGCSESKPSSESSATTAAATATSAAAATTTSGGSDATSTSVPTSTAGESTTRAVALDVEPGGPYTARPNAAVELSGVAAVAGQIDTVRDLTSIGRALVAYRDANGAYPPASLATADGRPGLSWRVLLLPYLGQGALYDKFDLTRPWDDPANRPLLDAIPDVYRDAGAPAGGRPTDTSYAGVGGPKGIFRAAGASLAGGVPLSSVPDGSSMTAGVGPVGAGVQIPWTSPGDVDLLAYPSLGTTKGFDGPGDVVTPLAFLDGAVYSIPDDTDRAVLHAWASVASGGCTPPQGESVRFALSWDLDGDGTFETSGSTAEVTAPASGDRTVRLRATTDTGSVFDASTDVKVA